MGPINRAIVSLSILCASNIIIPSVQDPWSQGEITRCHALSEGCDCLFNRWCSTWEITHKIREYGSTHGKQSVTEIELLIARSSKKQEAFHMHAMALQTTNIQMTNFRIGLGNLGLA